MKKIFTILLALSALSIVMSGCKKADEATPETKPVAEGTEKPTEEAK